ncbi:MAG TPA: class II aldolase/adducin family protein [Candidatus Dormibacteraeota bacterium]|nr:class II aldolase/adducin family protein [Candidatus Dormibacteraeota bacterium]
MELDAQRFFARRPPHFESKQAERTHVLQRLAAACRIFGTHGYSEGLLGHLTVRDPEHQDRFWVNPVGVAMRHMKVTDLVQVTHNGEIVQGRGSVNPAGLLLHSALHQARPEVTAVCHAHAPHASAWASLGRLVDPITQDSCILFEHQALIEEPRIVRNSAQARRFADAFAEKRVAIHAGHGIFTTGETIDEAAWWFVLLEKCCEGQLRAEAVGKPALFAADDARWIASVLGTPQFGWLSFQTLWYELLVTDPDLRQQST